MLNLDEARAEYARRWCCAWMRDSARRAWCGWSTRGPGAWVELAFGQNWRGRPSEALLKQLRELAGPEAV